MKKRLQDLWNADFGWWNVPTVTVAGFILATILVHAFLSPLGVGWGQSALGGLLGGVLGGTFATAGEAKSSILRRAASRR